MIFDGLLLKLRNRILVPSVLLGGVALWLGICQVHYQSYWLGTIFRVQTTDFNLLHHTLPPVLSDMILADREDLVQRTLDSTYGLFGLVITDPTGENVLYKTDRTYHRLSWQDRIAPDALIKEEEPYDLLTNPPQLEPLYEHKSPRSAKAEKVSSLRPGTKVLGRLYYLRSAPPSFSEDIGNFIITGFWELSGSKRGYFYITLSCIGFTATVLLLIWLRRRGLELKQKELHHIQRELDIRKKALENLGNELATQKARKVWLEREADQAYKRALGLKQSLEKLKESLTGGGQDNFAPPATLGADGTTTVNTGANNNNPGRISQVRIRPPVAPPGSILEEIESILPALSENAKNLRSQADILQDYCGALEERQVEMRRIVENAFSRTGDVSRTNDENAFSRTGDVSRTAESQEADQAGASVENRPEYIDMSPR